MKKLNEYNFALNKSSPIFVSIVEKMIADNLISVY